MSKYSSISCIIHLVTRVSQTLLMVDIRDIGHSLSAEGVGTTFGTGTTTACFHCHGTIRNDSEES